MKKIMQMAAYCSLLVAVMTACKAEEMVDTPSELTATALTTTTASLSWAPVKDAENYKLVIGDSPAVDISPGAWQIITYRAAELCSQTKYKWKVQAVRGSRASKWVSGPDFATPAEKNRPEAPSGLTAAVIAATKAELSWQAVEGVDKYTLVIGLMDPIEVNGTVCIATGLSPDTKYSWKVHSVAGNFMSDWALGPEFTTGKEDIDAPSSLEVGNVDETSAEFSWGKVGGIEKYNLTISGLPAVEVTGTSYRAVGLVSATDYTWKMQSVSGSLVSDWTDGPCFTTTAKEAPEVPTSLNVTEITPDGALLSWEQPNAEFHEIAVNGGAAVKTASTSYRAVDLAPETINTWKVRSARDGMWSAWAAGEPFTTTKPRTQFVNGVCQEYCGDYYDVGGHTFIILFSDFDPQASNPSGIQLKLDIITGPIDMESSIPTIDLPQGTYPFVEMYDVTTKAVIYDGATRLYTIVNGVQTEQSAVTGGTMTIEGTHANYTITFDVTHAKGKLHAEYKGPLHIKNPNWRE